jgi:formylglycine-generating enzyme required for sulfatase activity
VAPKCDPLEGNPDFSLNFNYCHQYHWCVNQSGVYQVKPGFEQHSVNFMTGANAEAYAAWVGGQLPTKDEWEIACRGPERFNYPWGDEPNPQREYANFSHNYPTGTPDTTEVRKFPKDHSGYDVYDMIGNVRERLGAYEHYPGLDYWVVGGYFASGGAEVEPGCQILAKQAYEGKHQGFGIRVVIRLTPTE